MIGWNVQVIFSKIVNVFYGEHVWRINTYKFNSMAFYSALNINLSLFWVILHRLENSSGHLQSCDSNLVSTSGHLGYSHGSFFSNYCGWQHEWLAKKMPCLRERACMRKTRKSSWQRPHDRDNIKSPWSGWDSSARTGTRSDSK